MFIWYVLLVSVNIVTIKAENDLIKIEIKGIKKGMESECKVSLKPKIVRIADKSNFTLAVQSHFFILESNWTRGQNTSRLEYLNDYNVTIKNQKKFNYTYFHTELADSHSGGNWTFSFKILKNIDPWRNYPNNTLKCDITTQVEIIGAIFSNGTHHHHHGHDGHIGTESRGQSSLMYALIVIVTIFGVLLTMQSCYIIREKKKRTRNIANRPPLPLPVEAVTEVPPSSMAPARSGLKHPFPTAPPMPVENSYNIPHSPIMSKRSYGNEGLDTSDEIVRSPMFGRRQNDFLVPKQSYRKKKLDNSVKDVRSPGLVRKRTNGGPIVPKQVFRKNTSSDDSDEEPKLPGFVQRQIEAKLASLPPKPSKNPKPLPRAPAMPPPEKTPALNPPPPSRIVPVAPLPPPLRKLPACPPPASFKDNHRISDDEWQYEALQPSSNYLNNFPNSNYNNMLA